MIIRSQMHTNLQYFIEQSNIIIRGQETQTYCIQQ